MRRSKELPLTLLAVLAITVTGCRGRRQNCVDSQNRILPNTSCSTTGAGGHYIYGGSSRGRVGDAVVGGSVSRGGFGGIGGSHGFAGGA